MENKMKFVSKKVKGIILELGSGYSGKTFLYTGDQSKLLSVLNELVAIENEYINDDLVEDAPSGYVWHEGDTNIEIKLAKSIQMVEKDWMDRYVKARRKYYDAQEAKKKAAENVEA